MAADNDTLTALIKRCGEGDERALKTLYSMTSPKLYALLLRILKKPATAQDVLQEVFLKVWNKANDYYPGKGSVMTWMSTFARNRAIDEIRRFNPIEPGSEFVESEIKSEVGGWQPLDEAIKVSEARSIEECLGRLEENQKQSIFLAFFQGKTHIEIGRVLNVPLGTIKTWVRRGLKQLKECLEV